MLYYTTRHPSIYTYVYTYIAFCQVIIQRPGPKQTCVCACVVCCICVRVLCVHVCTMKMYDARGAGPTMRYRLHTIRRQYVVGSVLTVRMSTIIYMILYYPF